MKDDILHVLEVQVVRGFIVRIEFSEETVKVVDVKPLPTGPVFEPVNDPDFFARVAIDLLAQTVVWPNGADLAPEALYELESLEGAA
jgi:hypothetical protein